MSDFLLIVPPGWTQLDWEQITNNVPDMSAQNVREYINSGMLNYIEEPLKTAQIISPAMSLVEAKLIDDEFFLVRLVVTDPE